MSENLSRYKREESEQRRGLWVLDSDKATLQRDPLAACLGSTELRSQHKQGINTAARGGGAGLNIKDNTFLPAASGAK